MFKFCRLTTNCFWNLILGAMEPPNHCFVFHDASGVKFEVWSYRELGESEAANVVWGYLQTPNHRRGLKSGMTVKILTMIGSVRGI